MKILIRVRPPVEYGYGHIARMSFLATQLRLRGARVVISLDDTSPAGFDRVVLDARDDSFGLAGESSCKKIAIDNLGQGRDEADLVVYCLPHLEMQRDEIIRSLQFCLLPPAIMRRRNMVRSALVKRVKTTKSSKGFTWRPPWQRPYTAPSLLPVKRRAILQAPVVQTYFGQTLFEAIYLGKKVMLYDIGEYHRRLADWFMNRVYPLPLFAYYFDGQGLHRLADEVMK